MQAAYHVRLERLGFQPRHGVNYLLDNPLLMYLSLARMWQKLSHAAANAMWS